VGPGRLWSGRLTPASSSRQFSVQARVEEIMSGNLFLEKGREFAEGASSRDRYSMMTVDCPEISNRFRQRMFLQAIMSSFRTM